MNSLVTQGHANHAIKDEMVWWLLPDCLKINELEGMYRDSLLYTKLLGDYRQDSSASRPSCSCKKQMSFSLLGCIANWRAVTYCS